MGEFSSFPWPGKSKLLSSFTLIFSASGLQNKRCFNWLSTRPSKQNITISYGFVFDPRPFYTEQQIPETKGIYWCITKEVNTHTCISLCTHTLILTNRRENAMRCQAPAQYTAILGAGFYNFHIPLGHSRPSALGRQKRQPESSLT